MYRCPFYCIAPHRVADVQVSVLLRYIERQMSLEIMAEADFMSNRTAVCRDTTNSA